MNQYRSPLRGSRERPSVRFQRHSWDDTAAFTEHPLMADSLSPRKSRSSSPVRRRPFLVKPDSRKYLKIEAKALREAWLNEHIFPRFGVNSAAGNILEISSHK